MLQRLEFSIDIKSSKENIWKALWEDQYYRAWIGVFAEGSYYVADNLSEGNTIMFLGPDKNGIHSIIEKSIPQNVIHFKHIGAVVEGKEQPLDDQARKWTGATEHYSLHEGTDGIKLVIQIDILDEHLEFMSGKFPEALQKIKSNSYNLGKI